MTTKKLHLRRNHSPERTVCGKDAKAVPIATNMHSVHDGVTMLRTICRNCWRMRLYASPPTEAKAP